MSILSFEFIFFMALVVFSYYLVPLRKRWLHLLAASMIFYGLISPTYLLLVMVLTGIDFVIARAMDGQKTVAGKKFLLLSGLAANVGVLFFFKFLNPLARFFQEILALPEIAPDGPLVRVLAPLGISYYIFKKISYLVDVYRGRHPSEKKPGKLLLYVLFFPEITAGPIDRATVLIPQFSPKTDFNREQIQRGIQLILWGLFKKLVIADRLAGLVNQVYDQPTHFQGPHLILATVCFSIQIYCDFSGYTDIALGIGHTLGYRLSDNFDRPYFSRSIREFWTRWHITLSHWLRDYLFLPLAYWLSRKMKRDSLLGVSAESLSYSVGVLVTMAICGIWHGADFTFLIWGLLHGVFLAGSFYTRKTRKRIKKALGISRYRALDRFQQRVTCFLLVTFSWIFFRADSLSEGFLVVYRIFNWGAPVMERTGIPVSLENSLRDLAVAGVGVVILFLTELLQTRISPGRLILERPAWQRWILIYAAILVILIFGGFQTDIFIYEGF